MKTSSGPPNVPRNLQPWARISVLGPHSFHVSWGLGVMRLDFTIRFTAGGAARLRDRKLIAMTKRAEKSRMAEQSIAALDGGTKP